MRGEYGVGSHSRGGSGGQEACASDAKDDAVDMRSTGEGADCSLGLHSQHPLSDPIDGPSARAKADDGSAIYARAQTCTPSPRQGAHVLVYPPDLVGSCTGIPRIFEGQGLQHLLRHPGPRIDDLSVDQCFDNAIKQTQCLGWFIATLPTASLPCASKISDRICVLCDRIVDLHSFFTIVGPTDHPSFDARSAKTLERNRGVRGFVIGLKSRFRVLTNADWVRPGTFDVRDAVMAWLRGLALLGPLHTTAKQQSSEPFLRGVTLKSAKDDKEREDKKYPGGLRNPNSAVAQSPSLRRTGARVRQVFEKIGTLGPLRSQILEVIQQMGTSKCQGFPPELIATASNLLRSEFGLENRLHHAGFDADLWAALLTDANDPELEVPRWLAEGCPTGIGDSIIAPCGVFPPATGISSAIQASKVHALLSEQQQWRHESHKNYVSFYIDDGRLAEDEVRRIADKDFIERFRSWDEVVTRWPKAIASKVALIVKERDDGTTKVRMVIDLRRSGGNGDVILPERVVLPRLSDLTASIGNLLDRSQAADRVELAVVDFEDAFHTLSLRERDRGVMAIRTLNGWAVFRRLCCGMAAAPLVWCRVGAAAGRLGQSLFLPHELRLQIFVDDPAIVTQGTPEIRHWRFGVLLLFWSVLGFRFNWPKAHRGHTVPWIGAQVTVKTQDHVAGVLAELNPKKFCEIKGCVNKLRKAKGMVDLKVVKTLAGQLSWASGLFPWIRSFNTMLWGAIAAHTAEQARTKWSAKKRPMQLFFVVRITRALDWIAALFAGAIRGVAGKRLSIQRWIPSGEAWRVGRVAIRTDASPFGCGGILFIEEWPAQWFAQEWTDSDAEIFGATLGDPAWQAEWELIALLLAVDAWIAHLRDQRALLVQLDATAALYTAARGAGRTPVMNAIAAEIALRMESAGATAIPEHLCGTLNFECDALSRLSQGADLPPALTTVSRIKTRTLGANFFLAWPRAALKKPTHPNPKSLQKNGRLQPVGQEARKKRKRNGAGRWP